MPINFGESHLATLFVAELSDTLAPRKNTAEQTPSKHKAYG